MVLTSIFVSLIISIGVFFLGAWIYADFWKAVLSEQYIKEFGEMWEELNKERVKLDEFHKELRIMHTELNKNYDKLFKIEWSIKKGKKNEKTENDNADSGSDASNSV